MIGSFPRYVISVKLRISLSPTVSAVGFKTSNKKLTRTLIDSHIPFMFAWCLFSKHECLEKGYEQNAAESFATRKAIYNFTCLLKVNRNERFIRLSHDRIALRC